MVKNVSWDENMYKLVHKGQFTWVPSHLRSMYAMVAVQSMKVGTYHFTRGPKSQVLSPNYDMDAYMATLSEGEARDLC
jgi:hypothetical protein